MRFLSIGILAIGCAERVPPRSTTDAMSEDRLGSEDGPDLAGQLPPPPQSWTLEGQVESAGGLASFDWSSMCARVEQVSPGTATVVHSGATIDSNGEFDITVAGSITGPLTVTIDDTVDCSNPSTKTIGDVYRSVNEVTANEVEDGQTNGTLGHTAYAITADYADELHDSAQKVDAKMNLKGTGFIYGFVGDDLGDSVDDATVDVVNRSETPMYLDTDPGTNRDDWFTDGSTANGDTIASGPAYAGWVVPVGPLASVVASHDDLTFSSQQSIVCATVSPPKAVFLVHDATGTQ